MKKTGWAFIVALTIALLTGLSPSAPAAAASTGETGNTGKAALLQAWKVRNTGDVGVGAIQVWLGQGPYYQQGQGLYDAVIPAGQFSGWAFTQGFYVGPGYCLRTRHWTNASGTSLGPVTRWGPGQLGPFDTTYGIDIRAALQSSVLCQRD